MTNIIAIGNIAMAAPELLATFAICVVWLLIALMGAAFFIWAERKVAGRIQDRLGPTRVGGRYGWLQSVADGIKLLAKEDIIPATADKLLFRLAPYVSFAAAFSVFVAIPLAEYAVARRVDFAVFLVLALASLEIYGVLLGGYASGSKWSLYGAMREAVQVVSYEVPLSLCALIPVMIAGSMDLVTIANLQQGMFWNWYVFHNPFSFIAFWVFLTCAIAGVNRAPFDLAEAESELVAGFMTEYSGFRWSVFMLAEYIAMFAVSCLAALLFLGGWNGPLPVVHWLGLTGDHGLQLLTAQLLGAVNLLLKGALGVCFMIWARWTLPRVRIDQVIAVCLKYCLPIAAACLLGTAVWVAF